MVKVISDSSGVTAGCVQSLVLYSATFVLTMDTIPWQLHHDQQTISYGIVEIFHWRKVQARP